MSTPRARICKNGVYNTSEYKEYITALCWEFARLKIPKGNYGKIKIQFNFKTPKGKKDLFLHTFKPDTDNCLKAVMDALEKHNIIENDSCFHTIHAEKRYTKEKSGFITLELL
jgi:Holliday junction resolvase RusA-like endonuclease